MFVDGEIHGGVTVDRELDAHAPLSQEFGRRRRRRQGFHAPGTERLYDRYWLDLTDVAQDRHSWRSGMSG